jgi:hypothetical protein
VAERKKLTRSVLIAELERGIENTEGQDPDAASFGYEEGMLLSRREAQHLLRLIRAAGKPKVETFGQLLDRQRAERAAWLARNPEPTTTESATSPHPEATADAEHRA